MDMGVVSEYIRESTNGKDPVNVIKYRNLLVANVSKNMSVKS